MIWSELSPNPQALLEQGAVVVDHRPAGSARGRPARHRKRGQAAQKTRRHRPARRPEIRPQQNDRSRPAIRPRHPRRQPRRAAGGAGFRRRFWSSPPPAPRRRLHRGLERHPAVPPRRLGAALGRGAGMLVPGRVTKRAGSASLGPFDSRQFPREPLRIRAAKRHGSVRVQSAPRRSASPRGSTCIRLSC